MLRWRRDVRQFSREALPAELLDEILASAELSPSVGNSQPWRWVEVRSSDRRRAVVESFARCNADALNGYTGARARQYASLKLSGLQQAPVHLAVFCQTDPVQGDGLGRQTMSVTVEYSVVTAISALWLAARARGVGVGWVSILEPSVVSAAVNDRADWRFVAYLCLGYPLDLADTPELERQRWQHRTDPTERRFVC